MDEGGYYFEAQLNSIEELTPNCLSDWFSRWLKRVNSLQLTFPTYLGLSNYDSEYIRQVFAQHSVAAPALVSLDVLCISLSELCANLIKLVSKADEGGMDFGPPMRASASLPVFMQEYLSEIRYLCLDSKDIVARTLARTLSEASDMLIALSSDEALAQAWIEHQDNAELFWRRYLSGDKLSKLRNSRLTNAFNLKSNDVGFLNAHRRAEFHDYSMAAHPSFQAGVMAIIEKLTDSWSDEESSGRIWLPGRTMRYSSSSVATAMCYFAVRAAESHKSEQPDLYSEAISESAVGLFFEGASVAGVLAANGLTNGTFEETVLQLQNAQRRSAP